MEVYVGRQPIFDRNMNVSGYELLYRRSMNNFYEGLDENQSTAALINNAFLSMQIHELTDGTRAFINFSLGNNKGNSFIITQGINSCRNIGECED